MNKVITYTTVAILVLLLSYGGASLGRQIGKTLELQEQQYNQLLEKHNVSTN